MDPFTQSVLLVCLGAIIALASGLLVEWLRGRSASKLEELRIKADADNRREDSLRNDERELHRALSDLFEIGSNIIVSGGDITSDTERLVSVCRHNYLLVSNVAVRQALADANVVITNREAASVDIADWTRAAAAASFVVAADIRGQSLPEKHLQELRDLQAKYRKP